MENEELNDDIEEFEEQVNVPEVPNEPIYDDMLTVIPVDLREMSVFESKNTDGQIGDLNIIHEITIGEIMITTVLSAILIFMILKTVILRGRQ